MKRWLDRLSVDTLFGRLFIVQLGITLILSGIYAIRVFEDQSTIFARMTAPVWATAIRPLIFPPAPAVASSDIAPGIRIVSTTIALVPGPPPPAAQIMPFIPRFRALAAELRREGIPVSGWKVSGETGSAITWLNLDVAGKTIWIGVKGDLEGVDVRRNNTLGVLFGVSLILCSAWWLSHRIARPLRRLEAHVRAFATSGMVPFPFPEEGPREVRRLARQFNAFLAERAERDDQRNMMLAGISHDLRTPLARIRMAAGLLPDHAGDGEIAVRRDVITRNVHLADQLIAAFLSLSRATVEPLDDTVDWHEWIQRIACDSYVGQLHLSVPDAPLPRFAPASRMGLERALMNLIENAVKYGQPPYALALYADPPSAQAGSSAQPGAICVSLRDHGPGIAAADREQLIKPFYRGDRARTLSGSGLGLAIVAETVKRHNGELILSDAFPGLCVTMRFACRSDGSRPAHGSLNGQQVT